MSKPRIIVGVDNSPGSHQATHWAADEAVRSDRELVVINVYDWHVAGARFQVAGGYADRLKELADDVVVTAVKDAEVHAPGVVARGETVVGSAGRALVQAASPDDLIVVGNRGLGGFASLLLGSVSHYVATHAGGPVVVVRGRPDADAGPVVVGIDTARGDTALRLAFEEAAARGTSVIAVHAYVPMSPVVAYGVMPSAEENEERHIGELTALREAVAVWTEKHPHVPIEISAVVGHPTEVLVGLSKTAQLVVVGHRGSGFGEVRLGAVASQLLHHAQCSVMIARSDVETTS
jgi:nucleotide-binding universal stress UspA family protein